MELDGVTFQGAPADEGTLQLVRSPKLHEFLSRCNGLVAFGGALHVRGVCVDPAWHSLARVMAGPDAFHVLYEGVQPDDIPFAQNALGDQYLLREEEVLRVDGETGEVSRTSEDLATFFRRVEQNPIEALDLQPLVQFWNEGQRLEPGELISVYPPCCTEEAANGVRLKAVPALELNTFLPQLARQMPESGTFDIRFE